MFPSGDLWMLISNIIDVTMLLGLLESKVKQQVKFMNSFALFGSEHP